MGHGGGSGQNRLNSMLWSEAQTWGNSQALGSSPLLSLSICLAQGFSLRQAQPFCCEAQKGILSCWVGIQSSQALSLTGALRARQSPVFQGFHGVPSTDSQAQGNSSPHLPSTPGAMYAWAQEVFIRPYLQIIQPQSHGFCLPKHSPAQPPEGEKPASLCFFLSKGLLGAGERQTRVSSV